MTFDPDPAQRELTAAELAETTAAHKTAAAILTCVVSGDQLGAVTLVDDLIGSGHDPIAGVLGAYCGIAVTLAPSLYSPAGLAHLRSETQRLATLEAAAALVAEADAATEARLATEAGS